MKYLCLGGWVKSQNDGQSHYIPSSRIASLYAVDPKLCVLVPHYPENLKRVKRGLIILRPDPTGKYVVPEART